VSDLNPLISELEKRNPRNGKRNLSISTFLTVFLIQLNRIFAGIIRRRIKLWQDKDLVAVRGM